MRHIDRRQGSGAGGPHEHAITGLAAPGGDAPPIDGRGYGFHHDVHNDLRREKRQHSADNDPLYDVRG